MNPNAFARPRALILVGVIAILAASVTCSSAQPFTIGGDPRVDPDDFRITTFASGLDFPYSMAELANGSILVGTSDPTGGSFLNSTGRLLRFADTDLDGVADAAPQVLFSGLAGPVTAVRTAGSLVLVTTARRTDESITVLRAGATPSDPLSLVGSIDFSFVPTPWKHSTYTLAVQPSDITPGQYDVYFNVGSKANATETTATVATSGLLATTLSADAIHRFTLTDSAGSIMLSNPTQIATGLRNAAGIAIDPLTGDLYFADNGIDGLVDPNEPLSVDELNQIAVADLGGAIEDFGFADDYIEYRTGVRVGSGALQPLVTFQPWPDPLTGSESEGPAEIAFAPAAFPTGLNHGIFAGFHGKSITGGLSNEENPLVYVDLDSGEYFPFIGNDEPSLGHLDSLLATADSLFVADLGASGSLATGGDGVIYQILGLPPPTPGDANRDGVVSGADFTIWADNFDLWDGDARWRHGDFNRDGYVTGADFTIWADNFDTGEAPVSVPEPGTLGLGFVATLGYFRRRIASRK